MSHHEHRTTEDRLDAIEKNQSAQGATQIAMAEDIAEMKKAILGNGQPGLVQRVTLLEIWRGQLHGAYVAVVKVGGIVSFLGGLATGAWALISKVLKHA